MMEKAATHPFVDAAAAHWKASGSKLTVVRRILCTIIGERDEFFDAEMLHLWAKRVDPAISLSSVYRTLSSLQEAGLVIEVEGTGEKKMHQKSLGSSTTSSHIVCRDCGKVIPIDDPCMGLRETASAKRSGFRAEKITLRMEASCDELAESGACGNRADNPPTKPTE